MITVFLSVLILVFGYTMASIIICLGSILLIWVLIKILISIIKKIIERFKEGI